MFRIVIILILAVSSIPHQGLSVNPYAKNIALAEEYLISHLNRSLGLVYESDTPGPHWLTTEYPNFHWRYNETYWLYSDNLFASLALRADYPQISELINESIRRYQQPPSGVFEIVEGEEIQLPLHVAADYVVAQSPNYVIMIRRHNATAIALNWLDLWLYEALEYDLEGNYHSAQFLFRRAETMWTGNGFWDTSYLFTHTYSNHKLALFLFTALALGIPIHEEASMLRHLWGMQNEDGGITSLADANGHPTGTANAETTALTLLIYDQTLIAKFPKAQLPNVEQTSTLFAGVVILAAILSATLLRRRPGRSGKTSIDSNRVSSFLYTSPRSPPSHYRSLPS